MTCWNQPVCRTVWTESPIDPGDSQRGSDRIAEPSSTRAVSSITKSATPLKLVFSVPGSARSVTLLETRDQSLLIARSLRYREWSEAHERPYSLCLSRGDLIDEDRITGPRNWLEVQEVRVAVERNPYDAAVSVVGHE